MTTKYQDIDKYLSPIVCVCRHCFYSYQQLLLATLSAYSFEKDALAFIYGYLSKRNQRLKVNSAESWREIKFGKQKDQF